MPIDPSISDMSWLTQSADPIGSLLKGASAGAQIARTRLEQAGLAQRVQEFQANQEVRQQQLAMELAQAPLHQKLLEQDAAFKAAQTEKMLYDRDTVVGTQQQLSGLAAIVSKALSESTPEAASPYFFDAVSKTPRIAENPAFQRLWQDVQTSTNAKIELERLKQANKDFTPEAVLIPSKVPGQPPYEGVRTGPNSYSLPQSTVTSFTTPTGEVFEQRTGAGGSAANAASGGLPQQVTNQIETKLSDARRAAALLDESLNLITPETVGPRGKVNAAIETGANILAPGSMATPVTKAQATFNATAQAQYLSLKADSQINKLEAQAMDKIAKVTDWWEAAATAREKYQTLRDLSGLQAIIASHRLNKIAPDEIIKGMSLDFVDKYRKQKTITDAEMGRWIDLHGGNEAVERMLLEQRK